MRSAGGCLTVMGAVLLLFGLLLLIAVLASYFFATTTVPTGRLLMLSIFLVGFWGLGVFFVWVGQRMGALSDKDKGG